MPRYLYFQSLNLWLGTAASNYPMGYIPNNVSCVYFYVKNAEKFLFTAWHHYKLGPKSLTDDKVLNSHR